MSRFRTPLSVARGLGSAHHGVGHWIAERVYAVALVPLVVWVVYAVLRLAKLDYASTVLWVRQPLNATLLVLTLFLSFQHMHGGVRVIIEDYIERPISKAALILGSLFLCGLAGTLAILSILKVALGGA